MDAIARFNYYATPKVMLTTNIVTAQLKHYNIWCWIKYWLIDLESQHSKFFVVLQEEWYKQGNSTKSLKHIASVQDNLFLYNSINWNND